MKLEVLASFGISAGFADRRRGFPAGEKRVASASRRRTDQILFCGALMVSPRLSCCARTAHRGLLSILLFASTGVANAGWISLCAADAVEQAESKTLATYFDAAGRKQLLVATREKPRSCASAEVRVDMDKMAWGALVADDIARNLDGGVILQGVLDRDRLNVSEIIPAQTRLPSGPVSAPIDAELLPALKAAPFGIEERARMAREEPLLLGGLAGERHSAGLDLPAGMLADNLAWSLLCPEQQARIEISSLRIMPSQPRSTVPGRALWAWRPQWWIDEPHRLLDELQAVRADTVYIAVPVRDDAPQVGQRAALQSFITEATRRGIGVWVVDGDPHAITPQARGEFVQRARAYDEYNRGVAENYRLQGIQYDIEPYLVPGN